MDGGILLLELERLSIFTNRIELRDRSSKDGVERLLYDEISKSEAEGGWFSASLTVTSKQGALWRIEPGSDRKSEILRAAALIEHFKNKAAGVSSSVNSPALLIVNEKPGWGKETTRFSERLHIYEGRIWLPTWRRTFPLNQILGIRIVGSGSRAALYLEIDGRSQFGGTYEVKKIDAAWAGRAKELLERLMAGSHDKNASGQDTATQRSDIPAQIRKLAELRDDGILSSEEFNTKKADLLSRM